MEDIVERLRAINYTTYPALGPEAADEIVRLRGAVQLALADGDHLEVLLERLCAATGGLPPALVAKTLDYAARSHCRKVVCSFTLDETTALEAATFQVVAP